MKRPPCHGEPALVHSTEETGDVQSFAIDAENFNPEILRGMSIMRDGHALGGYKLAFVTDTDFCVLRTLDDTLLSANHYELSGVELRLHSRLLTANMHAGEAVLLADLEQCAALMLLGVSLGDRPN
jgi:hypothetical protein